MGCTKKLMMKVFIPLVVLAVILAIVLPLTLGKDSNQEQQEKEAWDYILKLDKESGDRRKRGSLAEWAYQSNITDYNNELSINVSLEAAKEDKEAWTETIKFDWQNFKDPNLKRMYEKYSVLGSAALPEESQARLKKAISAMQSNYGVSKICSYKEPTKCDLALDPDLTDILANSRDPEELKHVWVEWHKAAGAKVRSNFTEYVELSNEAARANNYSDNAESWLDDYEDDDFESEIVRLWEELKPLYLQLHAYVRRKLFEQYGEKVLSRTGPIPAHLLGNMWAQTWNNIGSFSRPYPDKPDVDITSALVQQKYTPLKMFQTADEFFKSLNLTEMPKLFWENSIIEKPTDGRELICHASAWDFYDGKDFRIKQCTTITAEEFQTVHHEMGHVEYFLQYKDQPAIYKDGANPGFHEAVGDVIALSVSSSKHLKKIGLLPDMPDDEQTVINQQYMTSIDKIAFLPFALVLDFFRYGVFRGETSPDDYTCDFWNLREEYQGVEPPVTRSESDFDPAAKYHVSADVEYLRYYVSFVIQFQFHRALCEKAGEYAANDESKKLYNCDIYQSTKAGNALGDMLKLGSSRPWPDAMELLTGERKMSSSGILEYFKPLQEWLEDENKKTGEKIGWNPSKIDYCTDAQKAALAEKRKKAKRSQLDSINK